MDAIISQTHPVQLGVVAGAVLGDVVGLAILRSFKQQTQDDYCWETKRNAYILLIVLHVVGNCFLDVYFSIHPMVFLFKNFASAFSVGLLDYYFSATKTVSYHVLFGVTSWCFFQSILPKYLMDRINGQVISVQTIHPLDPIGVAVALAKFYSQMLGVGVLSDLIFSPMHRMLHHPSVYAMNHKKHHDYTDQITSLVLYHGTSLDDMLMPFTTTIGQVLWWLLIRDYYDPWCNMILYLVVPATLFSHAHDARCAHLMVPGLPENLNFVAYHHLHHLEPSKHYGLTLPSDLFWDFVLGVDTRKIDDVKPAKKQI